MPAPDEPTRTTAPTDVPPAGMTLTDDRGPSGSGTAVPHAAPGSGPRPGLPEVPGYAVTGEVGRGGMGVVYAAHDPAFDREVAVKVMHSGQDAGRFVVESRVTAQLPHPGVPPVYALGELADGRPFLAMKLVRGRTLAAELAAADRATDLPHLLGVFEQVCQTVGYAHAQGVVHRDLKPANVMVGEFGEVQVMDWGLARAGDRRHETGGGEDAACGEAAAATAGVMGTPAYMAPEQARGEPVDARADVFSLGCVLFEVLVGGRVYGEGPARVIVLRAAGAMLDDAFARLDGCGADPELVALARRCLAPAAADRPADGGAVAGAVAAYRAAVEDRLRKAEAERAAAAAAAREQRKRRRVQRALAAALVLMAAGGGAFAWWRADQKAERRVEDERRAGEQRQHQGRNRDALVAALDRAEDALRAGDAEVAAAALQNAGKRVAEEGAGELGPRYDGCRADLALLEALDAVLDYNWTPTGVKYPDRASTATRWERVFAGIGIAPGTTPAGAGRRVADSRVRERLLEALDLWLVFAPSPWLAEVLHDADPDAYRDAVRAAVLAGKADQLGPLAERPAALEQPTRFAVALGMLPRTLALAKRQRRILTTAAAAHPGNLAVLMALADTWEYTTARGGKRPWLSEELEYDAGRDGEPTTTPVSVAARARWYQAALAARPRNLAARLGLGVVLAEGVGGNPAEGVAVIEEAIRSHPDHPLAHYNLGFVRGRAGDHGGAVASFRKAAELDPTFAAAHSHLGYELVAKGDPDGAAAAFRESLRRRPNDPYVHFRLGHLLFDKGDLDGALGEYRRSVELEPTFGPGHFALGNVRFRKGDTDEAVTAYLAAIRLDPVDTTAVDNLVRALARKGDAAATVAACREALKHVPVYPPLHVELGAALHTQGDLSGAMAAYRTALKFNPEDGVAHHNLGLALHARGDVAAAVASYREAIGFAPKSADARRNLGVALNDAGDEKGAVAAWREAIELNPGHAAAHTNLGLVLLELGDPDGAIAALKEVVRLDPRRAESHYNLGVALSEKGDLEAALAAVREACRLAPADLQHRAGLAALVKRRDDRVAPPPREVNRP